MSEIQKKLINCDQELLQYYQSNPIPAADFFAVLKCVLKLRLPVQQEFAISILLQNKQKKKCKNNP
jgi:hypothetical protein